MKDPDHLIKDVQSTCKFNRQELANVLGISYFHLSKVYIGKAPLTATLNNFLILLRELHPYKNITIKGKEKVLAKLAKKN